MKNKKRNKQEKGGLYIALCSFALVIAAVGYVGKKNEPKQNNEYQETVYNDIEPLFYDNDNDNITDSKEDAALILEEGPTEVIETEIISSDDEPQKEIQVSSVTENDAFVLTMPVKGELSAKFSDNKPIFNEQLADWRTHNGIDISCEENSAIYCAYDGIISDIYDNPMGKNIKIDHQNGYETVYSNMSDKIEINIGDKVKCGDLLGRINNTSYADFTKSTHLHFEVLYNGEYKDPLIYLDN